MATPYPAHGTVDERTCGVARLHQERFLLRVARFAGDRHERTARRSVMLHKEPPCFPGNGLQPTP